MDTNCEVTPVDETEETVPKNERTDSLKTFGAALYALKDRRRVTRKGWNGRGMWLALALPTRKRHRPYIYMKTVDDEIVPWVASQSDLLNNDWVLLGDDT